MNRLAAQCRKFITYLWGKKSELGDMDERDALLAKVVLDIHRHRTHSDFTMVPLFSLLPIHPINRDNAVAATRARIKILSENREQLAGIKHLTRDILNSYIPSVSGFKTVHTAEQTHVAFEGNGRLYALQSVFKPEDEIVVEVEQYHFSDKAKILRRIERVRKSHGLVASQPGRQAASSKAARK